MQNVLLYVSSATVIQLKRPNHEYFRKDYFGQVNKLLEKQYFVFGLWLTLNLCSGFGC